MRCLLFSTIALVLVCAPGAARAGDSKEHFRSECKKEGVILCAEFASTEEIASANGRGQGVPNTPNNPLKNGKCRWNAGGQRDCYPVFRGGNCADKDALLATPGRAQTDDPVRASLWSPCYDAKVDGARITSWQDLGSSIGTQNIGWPTGKKTSFDNLWLQYELRLAPGMWQSFQGSNTSKLYRMMRHKTGNCRDKRFADGRFLLHSESTTRVGIVTYCGIVNASKLRIDLAPDMANRWVRITTQFAMAQPGGDFVRFIALDVESGRILVDAKESRSREGGQLELEPVTPRGWFFLHHASSRKRVRGAPDGGAHWWVRHNIASTREIRP